MPWKQWAYLEKVASADFQSYLQNQVVAQFTSAAQRDTIYATPVKGAMCLTVDTMTLWAYNGTAWVSVNVADGSVGLQATAMRVIAEYVATANTGSIGTTALVIPGRVATFTPVAGRVYYMRCAHQISIAAPSAFVYHEFHIGASVYGQSIFPQNNAAALNIDLTTVLSGLPMGSPVSGSLYMRTSASTIVVNASALSPALWQILERGA